MKLSLKLALATAAAATVGVLAMGASPTSAHPGPAGHMHIKQASIADHADDCPDGIVGAHIVLNQIASAPATIEVTTSDGSEPVALWKQTGKVGHYNVSLDEGETLLDAVAIVPTTWKGQFVLSHYECGTTTTTTTKPPYGS